jgi:hypothetical protein
MGLFIDCYKKIHEEDTKVHEEFFAKLCVYSLKLCVTTFECPGKVRVFHIPNPENWEITWSAEVLSFECYV